VGTHYHHDGPWPARSSDNRSSQELSSFCPKFPGPWSQLTLFAQYFLDPGIADPPATTELPEWSAVWCCCYNIFICARFLPGSRSVCLGGSPSHTLTASAHTPTPRSHPASCPRANSLCPKPPDFRSDLFLLFLLFFLYFKEQTYRPSRRNVDHNRVRIWTNISRPSPSSLMIALTTSQGLCRRRNRRLWRRYNDTPLRDGQDPVRVGKGCLCRVPRYSQRLVLFGGARWFTELTGVLQ
jgi:hypothetical protein